MLLATSQSRRILMVVLFLEKEKKNNRISASLSYPEDSALLILLIDVNDYAESDAYTNYLYFFSGCFASRTI